MRMERERNGGAPSIPLVPVIREAGYVDRWPHETVSRRSFGYVLLYANERSFTIRVERREERLHAGEFALIQPNMSCRLRMADHAVVSYARLDMFYRTPSTEEEQPQPSLLEGAGICVPVKLSLFQPKLAGETMRQLIGAWQRNDSIGRVEAQSFAAELVLLILKAYSPRESSAAAGQQPLGWVPSYLSARLAEPLTVDDMARKANLSSSQFAAIFHKAFGSTPYRYLVKLRIRQSRKLLENTDWSQQTIAEHCGFADVHHFSKAFKKATGQTPGEYKVAMRQQGG